MNALNIIRAILVVVVSLILSPVAASATLHPLVGVAAAYAVVVFLWDVLFPLAAGLTNTVTVDLEYLVKLAAVAVIVGTVAVSTQIKSLVGEPTVTTFAVTLLGPGILSVLVNLAESFRSTKTVAAA